MFKSSPGPVRHAPRTPAQKRAGKQVIRYTANKVDLQRALSQVGKPRLKRVKDQNPVTGAINSTLSSVPLISELWLASQGSNRAKQQIKAHAPQPVKDSISVGDRALSGQLLAKPLAGLEQALHKNDEYIGGVMGAVAGGISRPTVTGGKGGGAPLAVARPPVALDAAASKRAGAFSLRGLNDLLDLPANAIPALYVPARTAEKGDPAGAAKMLAQPYVDAVKHPGRSFSQHPVSTALLFSGLEGGVGRGVGKVLRSVPSRSAREYASLGRPTARSQSTKLPDGTVLVNPLSKVRTASKDIFVNRAQKAKDRGNPTPQTTTHDVNHRVDQFQGYREDIRRNHRKRVLGASHEAETNTIRPTGGPVARSKQVAENRKTRTESNAATVLSTQNIARPHELKAYLGQLRDEEPNLSGARLKENKANQKRIEKALKTAGPKTVAAGERYAELSVKLQDELVKRDFLPSSRAEKARLISYAVQRMGAKHTEAEGIVAVNGRPLTADAIRADMAERGFKEPAFVSHAPGQGGSRNFSVRAGGGPPPKVSGTPRTGRAVTEGTLPLHEEVLREQAAKAQGMIDAHDSHADFLKTFGLHRTDGRLFTRQSFQDAFRDALDHNTEHPDAPVRPVRVSPFSATKEQLGKLVDDATVSEDVVHRSLNERIDQALSGENTGDGPWALVPDAAAARMQQHIGVTAANTTGAKLAQVFGAQFRSVVLATNPKWLAGNHVEGAGRLAVAHAGPRSWITGRKAMAKADPALLEQLKSLTTGGGHYALQRRAAIVNTSERFQGTTVQPIADALHAFFQAPGPKHVAGVWRAYTNFVFNSLNGLFESDVYQTALLGKALRDHPLMDKHFVKLSDRAISEVAQGISNPEHMAELADSVDRMYGKYNNYGPTMRKYISGATPFIPWSLSALRFILDVLPRDHPVFTSLIASANIASADWLRQHGLQVMGPGRKPGFLQGSIPGKDGSNLRISHYTPFSLWGDPLGTLADSVFPQGSAIIKAWQGRDWKGNKLKGRAGDSNPDTLDSLWASVTAGGEAFIPLAGQMTRYFAYEGTVGSKLRKIGDPFMYTQSAQPSGAGEVVSSPAPSGPQDRTTVLLNRRAHLIGHGKAAATHTEEILAKRARLLGRTP